MNLLNNEKGGSHVEIKWWKEKKICCVMNSGGIDEEYGVEGYT